jgi:hypothetical protein
MRCGWKKAEQLVTDSAGNITTSAIKTDLLIGTPLADISVALGMVESREKSRRYWRLEEGGEEGGGRNNWKLGAGEWDSILEGRMQLEEIFGIFDGHTLELAVTDLMLVKLVVRKDQRLDGHFLE